VKKYEHKYLFGKRNIILILIGIGLMLLGYVLMIGGGSEDPMVYPAEEIYGFQRTVLAPILVIAGLVLQIFAILRKPHKTDLQDQES